LGANKGNDTFYLYKDALSKTLEQLIGNAVKFTHKGKIHIGYTSTLHHFEFFVKDTGIGIPEGEEKIIFELFRQQNNCITREFGGNGIGLSIVKKYVEFMKGEVWVEPNQEQGALFIVKIPNITPKQQHYQHSP
jgi:signal transduction histidine kinase